MKTVRWAVWAVLVGGIGLAVGVFSTRQTAAIPQVRPPRVIEAQTFRLVDAAGKPRATLDLHKDSPGLRLLDAAGVTRMLLRLGPHDRPYLTLFDAAGKERAGLGVGGFGAFLGLCDVAGKPTLLLSAGIGGAVGPRLTLLDAAGKPRALLSVGKDRPFLALLDAARKVVWSTRRARRGRR